jgi:hypothetical protein
MSNAHFSAQPEGSEPAFVIGKSKADGNDKKKKKKPEQIGEERMKETFGIGLGNKDQDDLKRKREEYAINLRKSKK